MSKLEEILRYVSIHNDFYKKTIKDNKITDPIDIRQYPILTKSKLHENRYSMFSNGFAEKYYSKKLIRTYTSGSSGNPVNVYWDEKDYNYTSVILWRMRNKFYGISPKDRVVKFSLDLMVENNSYTHFKDNIMLVSPLVFNNSNKLEDIVNKIYRFSPKWLSVYPHVLEMLCDYYNTNLDKIPPSITHIETLGEVLDDKLKERGRLLFKVPIINHYGTEEVRSIAYECPFGNMHVFSDNVFVETCGKDGEYNNDEFAKGSVVVTSLTNYAMPLIRYEIGDYIELLQQYQCPCGICSPIIRNIEGRINESFIINGKRIDSNMLKDIIHKLNNCFADPIQKYKFIFYKSTNDLHVFFELSMAFWDWKEEIKKAFVSELLQIIDQKPYINISFFFNDFDRFKNKKAQVLQVLD